MSSREEVNLYGVLNTIPPSGEFATGGLVAAFVHPTLPYPRAVLIRPQVLLVPQMPAR